MTSRYRDRWLFALAAFIALAFLGTACDDEDEGAVAPTATPEPEARATSDGERAASVIVFLRGTDLWVASLDGQSVPPRAITSGSLGAGYAGYVRGADGSMDLYYVSQLTEPTESTGDRTAEFGLYRIAVEGGEPEELLRFSSAAFRAYEYPVNASVSPDGKHVMYTDAEGLKLLDLSLGESRRLLENGNCVVPPDPIGACWSYNDPKWAPRGGLVMVTKFLWESSLVILVNPFESPVGVTETAYGFNPPELSPDAGQLCISSGYGIDEANVLVYDIASEERTDLLPKLPLPTTEQQPPDVRGCVWSPTGQLAIGYAPDYQGPGRIAFLDDAFNVVEESDPIEHLDAVAGWLPDGSGVAFNRRDRQVGSPEAGSLPPGIFYLDQGVQALPFEADRVLGVIP